jgi:hypothetical protein
MAQMPRGCGCPMASFESEFYRPIYESQVGIIHGLKFVK